MSDEETLHAIFGRSACMRNIRALTAICLFIIATHASAAGWRIWTPNPENDCSVIQMRGEIVEGDAALLATLIDKNDARNRAGCSGHGYRSVFFDSNGGSVSEAMAIGRLIRAKEYSTNVLDIRKCISACNIAFVGGVARFVDGAFGIHRPYTDSLNLDESAAARQHEAIDRELRKYVLEMGVSNQLVEQMMYIAPSQVRYLSQSEMRAMGIIGIDPVWADVVNSRAAKKLGISKAELIRRQSQADHECDKGEVTDVECSSRVMNSGRP